MRFLYISNGYLCAELRDFLPFGVRRFYAYVYMCICYYNNATI